MLFRLRHRLAARFTSSRKIPSENVPFPMKEFVLLVDGQTVGPFPQEDLEARFSSGEYSAETPCAAVGDETWSTLGEMFPSKKKTVRIAQKTSEEEKEMAVATSEKLDPDVRKKLLLYNLADAISVDKFSPVQADVAIKLFEAELRKGRKLKIFASVGAFVAAFALGSLIFNFVEIGTAPGGKGLRIFEKIFEEPADPSHEKLRKQVLADVRKLNSLREEVAAIKFLPPRGQGSPRQTFLSNVVIKNPDVSTVTGAFDFSEFSGLTLPQGGTTEVVQLKRTDSEIENLMNRQREIFNIRCSPLWTNKELREAIIRDLAPPVFPGDPAIPESIEIWRAVTNFRADAPIEIQLQNLIRRVEDIAQSKDIQQRLQGRMAKKYKERQKAAAAKDNSIHGKATQRIQARQQASQAALSWAQNKMPKFFEKFSEYLAEKEIYFSAEERANVWNEFMQNDFPKIRDFVAQNEIVRAPVAGGNAFVLPGRNTRNIFANLKYANGALDVFLVPKTEAEIAADGETVAPAVKDATVILRDLKVNRRYLTPEDVLMDERYRIAEKIKTGGKILFASGKLCGQPVYSVRTTPEWFFISVEKIPEEEGDVHAAPSKKSRGIVLRVPVEFYDSVAVGDAVPMEKLLTFERFARPAESTVAGALSVIPPEEMEAVKAAQERAGIAFPPPPEAATVPAAPKPQEKEKTEPPAASEPASADAAEPLPAATDVPAEEE